MTAVETDEPKEDKQCTMILVFNLPVKDLAEAWEDIGTTIELYATSETITKNVVDAYDEE